MKWSISFMLSSKDQARLNLGIMDMITEEKAGDQKNLKPNTQELTIKNMIPEDTLNDEAKN